jgi:murein DD-endopeptidase MepM/ murein hydrolase activator NlpD
MIRDVTLTGLSAGDKLQPKELATKVQAMFIEIMIKSMEESVQAEEGLLGGSASSEIYRGMLREQMAAAMSGHLNSPLEHQLQRKLEVRNSNFEAAESEKPDSDVRNNEFLSALPVDGTISSSQGWRQDPITGEQRYHAGIDIAAPQGTMVRAVASGRVIGIRQYGGGTNR